MNIDTVYFLTVFVRPTYTGPGFNRFRPVMGCVGVNTPIREVVDLYAVRKD